MRIFLTGARILTDDGFKDDVGVLIEHGRILDVTGAVTGDVQIVRLPDDAILAPGFIDAQVNGGGGILFNDEPNAASALAIAAAHRRFGTTSLLPTLITDRPDKMDRAIAAVLAASRHPGGGVLGLHLEGPFISPLRPGVHDPASIRRLEPADLAWLETAPARLAGAPLLLTLAPEETDDQTLAALAGAGVILSAGHTAANAERIRSAIAAGLRGFTHLYNAMPPLAGRDPGPAGAALLDTVTWCGIIADGIHVHPDMLRLALRLRPASRMMLVTDAMPPLGTDATEFLLYGQTILRRAGRLERADGNLAGADLDMASAVRLCVQTLGVRLEEALRMASANPAAFLRVADRGRIAPGLRADLVLLSPGLNVLGTWVAGSPLGTVAAV